MRKRFFILFIIFWMVVIFCLSNQNSIDSSLLSSKVIYIISRIPFINYIIDYLISKNLGGYVIRKCAHMFLFFILSILLFKVLYKDNIKKTAAITFLCAFIYACSDEFHQLFIPGRSGEFKDVLIDSLGSIMGILLVSIITKYKNYKNFKNKQ